MNYHTQNWYIDEEEYIKPSMMKGDFDVEHALVCFEGGFYDLLTREFNTDRELSGLPAMLKGASDKDTAVIKSYFGAPAAAMLLEALVASDVNRVLMLGEAGSITEECGIGDVVIPTWGIREEGTSYHYFPPTHTVKSSEELVDDLMEYFDKDGGVWTTDAGFRETKSKIDRYAKRGVLAVEMECTALMAVAEYRNIDFAAVLIITDELFRDEWVKGFKSEEVKIGKKKVLEAVKAFLP